MKSISGSMHVSKFSGSVERLMARSIPCCPTCGRKLLRPLDELTPFRARLVELADGTRTYAEIARLLGKTTNHVMVALHSLRDQGYTVRGKDRIMDLDRGDYDELVELRQRGLSWREIGDQYGRSAKGMWDIYHKLVARFGEPPEIKKKRDQVQVRDYVRMRELREEAGLPWRMVGEALGMKWNSARDYYARLRKTYT